MIPRTTADVIDALHVSAETGDPLPQATVTVLARAYDRAILTQGSWEGELGFPKGWARDIAIRRRNKAIAALRRGDASIRSQAEELHSDLARYQTTRFPNDLLRGAAAIPEDVPRFEILVGNGGDVPSIAALRLGLTFAGRCG